MAAISLLPNPSVQKVPKVQVLQKVAHAPKTTSSRTRIRRRAHPVRATREPALSLRWPALATRGPALSLSKEPALSLREPALSPVEGSKGRTPHQKTKIQKLATIFSPLDLDNPPHLGVQHVTVQTAFGIVL